MSRRNIYTLPENWREWPTITVAAVEDIDVPHEFNLKDEDVVHVDEEEGIYALEVGDQVWYFDPSIENRDEYGEYIDEGMWMKHDPTGDRARKVAKLSKTLDAIQENIDAAIELAREAGVPLSLERMFRGELANVRPDGECWYSSYC